MAENYMKLLQGHKLISKALQTSEIGIQQSPCSVQSSARNFEKHFTIFHFPLFVSQLRSDPSLVVNQKQFFL